MQKYIKGHIKEEELEIAKDVADEFVSLAENKSIFNKLKLGE